ncbi:ribonuclease H-like protein, partial [Piromyces finnis]
MSHDFESFPNCYLYNDFISTISIVYHYKDIQRNIAICVKYKDENNIVNCLPLNEIDPSFLPFIDEKKFNNSCKHFTFFDESNNNENNNNLITNKDKDNLYSNKLDKSVNKENNNLVGAKESNKTNFVDKTDNYDKSIPTCVNKQDLTLYNNNTCSNNSNNNDDLNIICSGINNKTEIENRYYRLKKLLNRNYTFNSSTKDRFNRLKCMINNSLGNEKLIKDSLNRIKVATEKEEENTFEPIEEFITKHEQSKKDKLLKTDILNDKYDVIYVESEYDLICEFFSQIRKLDPDIIIGYNTFGFDYKYLAQRAGMHTIIDQKDSPFKANRIFNMPTKFINTSNNEVELKIPGRIAIDIFKYAKSLNMPSASLNYVSEQLLNKHKIDLPYKDMFYLIHENTDDSLNKVAM